MSDIGTSRDIGWAIYQMRHGERVCRRGWNGKGMWIALEKEPRSDWQPFVYMMTVHKTRVPWLCSQTDLLATDWESAT